MLNTVTFHAINMVATAQNAAHLDNGADPNMNIDPNVWAGAGAGIGVGFFLILILISLLLTVIQFAGLWKMFSKAGQPGILAIIPIVNLFFIVQVGGKPAWWGILFLIPIVGIVMCIIVNVAIAQRFGRGIGTALGLIFLPFIFCPILGFGSAQWSATD